MSLPVVPWISATIFDQEAYYESESLSLRRQVRSLSAQRWRIVATLGPLERDDAGSVRAFLKAQRGPLTSFTVSVPGRSDALGTVSGTVLVNAVSGYSAGDSSIVIDGITGTLVAGDFIKFAGHSKVYMVTTTLSGAGTLAISPPLVSAVTNNEAITYDSVEFTVRVSNDVQSYQIDGDGLERISITMIEAV